MLVQIFTHLTVGAEYEYSSITWSIKVEAPVISLNTDLLDVQEYVIHLVPEGDDETGITDVGITINQNDVRHSFIIQTPFELDVTSNSATLPTTKFVIGHVDILPGYGYNTYGNLPMIPFGVYSEDWSVVPISVLQDARFSDLYGENPAYQSIMNLYIDNTIDLSVAGVTTSLKYETFAVSGTIPLLESIVTTGSLIVKPEIPIQLTLNDVGISMSTQMDRELPVLITLADLDTYGEYVVIVSPTPSVVDMSVAASSVTPQKFASAQNIVSLYDIQLKDVAILNVAGNIFNDDLPQNAYEGTIGSFANSTFESSYLNYPLSFQEYIKVLPATTTEMNNLSVNREIVVRSEGNGFRYTIYDDGLLSDYASTPISALADFTFDTNLGTTTYDVTIKATTSPYTGGQSAKPNPTDIFRGEILVKTQSEPSAYDTLYEDVRISAFQTLTFNDVVPGTTDIIGQQTFGSVYPQSPQTSATYVKYEKIVGTVSSANAGFETLPISAYSAIAIDGVDDSLLSDLVPIVIGSGTDFSNESLPLGFAVGGVFVANNEYFTVESIANSTYMTTDRLPASPFSGVVAYRISA
jgi:hypothetical protein